MSRTFEYRLEEGMYHIGQKTVKKLELPPDIYQCRIEPQTGAPYLESVSIITDDLIDIPDSAAETVLEDISRFWDGATSEKFKQYGLVQKRGALMYGKQGTGKTVAVVRAMKKAIEMGAVCLFNPEPSLVTQFISFIKNIEPNKKVVVVFEEFESKLNRSEAELLSLLDGETQFDNVYYLATTNYIAQIPARIKNRPSRFALVFEVKVMDQEGRRLFFENKLHDSDKHLLESFVIESDGMVVDQMKDLVISVCCFNKQLSEAVKKIKDMEASPDSHGYGDYVEAEMKHMIRSTLGIGLNTSPNLRPIK